MKIIEATLNDLYQAAHLYDLYRQFYGKEHDIEAAKSFLTERFKQQDSKIFLAINKEQAAIGFIQLYPSFSSVAMKRMWYLNDLYVEKEARKCGVAKGLLEHVENFVRENGDFSLKLATAVDNASAIALYESAGYKKVVAFDHYVLRM